MELKYARKEETVTVICTGVGWWDRGAVRQAVAAVRPEHNLSRSPVSSLSPAVLKCSPGRLEVSFTSGVGEGASVVEGAGECSCSEGWGYDPATLAATLAAMPCAAVRVIVAMVGAAGGQMVPALYLDAADGPMESAHHVVFPRKL